jgi:hypothetical protein
VQKLPTGALFFDKRDSSQFDYLTVHETSNTPLTPVRDNSNEAELMNSPERLSLEATMIKIHSFIHRIEHLLQSSDIHRITIKFCLSKYYPCTSEKNLRIIFFQPANGSKSIQLIFSFLRSASHHPVTTGEIIKPNIVTVEESRSRGVEDDLSQTTSEELNHESSWN